MKNFLIAERYANALSEVLADDLLDDAAGTLRELAAIYADSQSLPVLLNSPAIELSRREALLRELMEVLNAGEAVTRLALVMLKRGRIPIIADVAAVFRLFADERLGRVRATVTTAEGLGEEQRERLVAALASWARREVLVEEEVVPDILGGVVARLQGTVIDGSVRTRIERLREELLSLDIRAEGVS